MQKELELNPVRYHILIILPQQCSFVHGDFPYNICKVGTVTLKQSSSNEHTI